MGRTGITTAQREWLISIAQAALAAEHVWPNMAGCEAALESSYGQSALARQDNNLFGMKQHVHPVAGTVILPTHEVLSGVDVMVKAAFVKYATIAECFEDRMETLLRLAPHYPHYAAALTATDSAVYIQEVSKSWSTDPTRASKVLAIYGEAFPYGNTEAVNDVMAGEN